MFGLSKFDSNFIPGSAVLSVTVNLDYMTVLSKTERPYSVQLQLTCLTSTVLPSAFFRMPVASVLQCTAISRVSRTLRTRHWFGKHSSVLNNEEEVGCIIKFVIKGSFLWKKNHKNSNKESVPKLQINSQTWYRAGWQKGMLFSGVNIRSARIDTVWNQ